MAVDRPGLGPGLPPGFTKGDLEMVRELATDPYVPLIGTLPVHADDAAGLAWIARQHGRLREEVGFSFCIGRRRANP